LAESTEKLEIKGLVKAYKGRKIVDNISMTLNRNEIVGLLGPNGAGKTTTFYMIIGLARPDQGSITLDGKDITEDPMYIRARKGINYLPQESSIFRKLTVEQNLLAIMEGIDIPSYDIKNRLEKSLSELNLSHLAKQKALSLSGGERRRLEITRALITEPRFILLDEPFVGIDPLVINDIKIIIRQLREKGIGIIITDHNVRETLDVCDSAYIISQGEIVEHGSPEKIVQSETARNIYLGENFSLL